MRIAINARLLLPGTMEGVSRYIWETSKRMIENHPEHEFFLFFDRKYDPSFVKFDNVTAVVIPPQARHPILWKIWFDFQVPRYLRKYKIDVFYSGDGYMSLRTKVPTALVIHDLAFLHYPEFQKSHHVAFLKKNTSKYLDRANQLIVVSEFTKDDILSHYKVSTPIHVAYNALPDESLRSSVDSLYDQPYFLYVGAIHPRKNIFRLVEAFEIFKEENNTNHQLVIAGRKAWYNKELDHLVEKSNWKNDIHFPGMVSDQDKQTLLNHADAFLYISLFEGFGIPVLESFRHKTPVITSKGTSMEEIAGDAAMLVDPENIHQIAQAMNELTSNEKMQNELIEKGCKRVNEFSWEKSSERVYKSLIEIAGK